MWWEEVHTPHLAGMTVPWTVAYGDKLLTSHQNLDAVSLFEDTSPVLMGILWLMGRVVVVGVGNCPLEGLVPFSCPQPQASLPPPCWLSWPGSTFQLGPTTEL